MFDLHWTQWGMIATGAPLALGLLWRACGLASYYLTLRQVRRDLARKDLLAAHAGYRAAWNAMAAAGVPVELRARLMAHRSSCGLDSYSCSGEIQTN